MEQNKLQALALEARSLSLFKSLLSDPLISAFVKMLSYVGNDAKIGKAISAASDFASVLYNETEGDFSLYILRAVYENENAYVKCIADGRTPSTVLEASAAREIDILTRLSRVSFEEFKEALGGISLPEWYVSDIDISAKYKKRVSEISKHGYGIYARHYMFRLSEGEIVPVLCPDETTLAELPGYEREKGLLIENTKSLLEGRPAANVLLSGDAGTGKSSTVKAIVNEFKDAGLRIIEVKKEELRDIPDVLNELRRNPLKFILFIDDLSFAKDDDNFGALKATLEGSVSAKSDNVAIYATSNRRHLVKESFSDRDGDDVHAGDTMQELASLSERFGLRITFMRPNKTEYLAIVHALATAAGLDVSEEYLDLEAEKFALQKAVRSPRAARQFVDSLIAKK